MATFRNTKYPALRFYAGGASHKFQGGRLAVEDEEMAEAIRQAMTDQNGIREVTGDDSADEPAAEQQAPEPEGRTGPPEGPAPSTTQDILDMALEMGILEEPMQAEDGIQARIENGTLVLTFADESTLAFRDGDVVEDEEPQDGQNAAADAEQAANAAEAAEGPSEASGDAVEADPTEGMNREQLRDALRVRGLATSGNVPELRERLAGAMRA